MQPEHQRRGVRTRDTQAPFDEDALIAAIGHPVVEHPSVGPLVRSELLVSWIGATCSSVSKYHVRDFMEKYTPCGHEKNLIRGMDVF
jgi:hypothetical protein